jgi:hypothetical protein
MIWEEELKSDPSEVKNIVANFMHLAFSKSVVTAYPVVQDLTILYSRLEASQTDESFRAYIARSWTIFGGCIQNMSIPTVGLHRKQESEILDP